MASSLASRQPQSDAGPQAALDLRDPVRRPDRSHYPTEDAYRRADLEYYQHYLPPGFLRCCVACGEPLDPKHDHQHTERGLLHRHCVGQGRRAG